MADWMDDEISESDESASEGADDVSLGDDPSDAIGEETSEASTDGEESDALDEVGPAWGTPKDELTEGNIEARIASHDGEVYDSLPEKEADTYCNARKTINGTGKYTGYCKNGAGKATDHKGEGRCHHHDPEAPDSMDNSHHEDNEYAVKHYSYSNKLTDDMAEEEVEWAEGVADTMVEGELSERAKIAAEAAAEALVRYRRSKNAHFLKEFRLLAKDFNLIPNAENVNMNNDGGIVVNLPGDGNDDDDVIDLDAEMDDAD